MKRQYKGTMAGAESMKKGRDDEILQRNAREDSRLLKGEVMSDGIYLTNDVNRAKDPGLKENMDTKMRKMRKETTVDVVLIGHRL